MRKLVLKKEDVTPSRENFEVIGAFNPGCAKLGDEVVLLVRVAERPVQKARECLSIPLLDVQSGEVVTMELRYDDPGCGFSDPRVVRRKTGNLLTSISHLRLARSADGERFAINSVPDIKPQGQYEEYGIEDPRITCLDGCYYITYSCASRHGILTGLIKTSDFCRFERMGYIFHPDNKDVAIFPSRIWGKYYCLHRPTTTDFGQRSIWLAESPDLLCWGNHKVLAEPRPGLFDSERVGASCVPFLTKKGWLVIYHGADDEGVYSLGAMLLDAENPEKVLARPEKPLMRPAEEFEVSGFYKNVVFSCGCVAEGDKVTIYYGAADTCVAKAEFTLEEIFRYLA